MIWKSYYWHVIKFVVILRKHRIFGRVKQIAASLKKNSCLSAIGGVDMRFANNRTELVAMLKRRYILALGIIIIMLIASEATIQHSLKLAQDDSRLINIAGKQRMYSQKINKAALGMYHSTESKQRITYYYEIYNTLNYWQKAHQGLQQGNKSMGLPGDNSRRVQLMYAEIEPNYQAMQEVTRAIIALGPEYNSSNQQHLATYLQTLQINEGDFLRGMDGIVFQYDKEARAKLQNLRNLEGIILLIALLTVCLEFLFIFRPTCSQVNLSLKELENSNKNLFKLFEVAPAAMLFVDLDTLEITRMNNLAKNLLKKILEQKKTRDLAMILGLPARQFAELWERIHGGEIVENIEVNLPATAEGGLVVLLSASLISYEKKAGALIGLVDITAQKKAEQILQKYASIDEMTGFMNKRSGLNFLEQAIENSGQQGEPLSVVFVDVDGLKQVNDRYGHEEGDYYIQQIAKVIRGNVDSQDVVFRYGGDEFVLILLNCSKETAHKILKRIVAKLGEYSEKINKDYSLEISYGIAEHGEQEIEDVQQLLARADQEMYLQKRKRKVNRKK